MNKYNQHIKSSKLKKGFSSSSHSRIKVVAPIATKFVKWNVENVDELSNQEVYRLRIKLNAGEEMTDEEKMWLNHNVCTNGWFKTAVPLGGWKFEFKDVLHKFSVRQLSMARWQEEQYYEWREYYAVDETSLRAYIKEYQYKSEIEQINALDNDTINEPSKH